MQQQADPNQKRRETVLAFMLLLLLGGAFFFFLNLVSLGIFMYVLIAVTALTMLGFLHYWLWGYAMMQETAGEREEEAFRQKLEDDEM